MKQLWVIPPKEDITRLPDTPTTIDKNDINSINSVVFKKKDTYTKKHPTTAIVFGAGEYWRKELIDSIKGILTENFLKEIIITWWVSTHKTRANNIPESIHFQNLLKKTQERYPKINFHYEHEYINKNTLWSTNTRENIEFALPTIKNIWNNDIFYIFKSHLVWRTDGYCNMLLPEINVYKKTYDMILPNINKKLSKDNRHEKKLSRSHVFGEILRMKLYDKYWHLILNEEAKEKLKQITTKYY